VEPKKGRRSILKKTTKKLLHHGSVGDAIAKARRK
jgi:hypothetical protein